MLSNMKLRLFALSILFFSTSGCSSHPSYDLGVKNDAELSFTSSKEEGYSLKFLALQFFLFFLNGTVEKFQYE